VKVGRRKWSLVSHQQVDHVNHEPAALTISLFELVKAAIGNLRLKAAQ
jgi:hypothetical protein